MRVPSVSGTGELSAQLPRRGGGPQGKRKPVQRIALLTGAAGFEERLREAVCADVRIEAMEEWRALAEWCRDAACGSIAVVDAFHGVPSRDTVAPDLPDLLAEARLTSFVVTLNPGDQRWKELSLCRRLAISEFITLSHDDTPYALRQRLATAAARPVHRLIAPVLPPHLSGRARAIIDAAGEVVAGGSDGAELCQRLGMSRRTLLRWTNEEALPPPRRLLAWIRVLIASALLDGSRRTPVAAIARACGYTTDSALGRAMIELVGEKPSALRRRGALAAASRAFVQILPSQ